MASCFVCVRAATSIRRRCALGVCLVIALRLAVMLGGCDSTSSGSHSRGLLKDDTGRGVNNPYIVRDPAQKHAQPTTATRPAEQPGAPQ